MNIVDFRNRKELYLLDLQSDATEYGGQSEVAIDHYPNENGGFMRMSAKFMKEREALHMMHDYMFCGW